MIEYDNAEFELYDLDQWIKKRSGELEEGQLELLKEKIRRYPPIPAKDMPPSWYTKDHILRHCWGIKWVTSRGYLMRAPIDITIDNFMIGEMAGGIMSQGFSFENGELPRVFKLDLPWMIRSKDKKPIDFLITAPAYHFKRDGVRIQEGIIAGDERLSYELFKRKVEKDGGKLDDFLMDPFGEEINPFFCSKTTETSSLVFKEGQPIVQLIPVYK